MADLGREVQEEIKCFLRLSTKWEDVLDDFSSKDYFETRTLWKLQPAWYSDEPQSLVMRAAASIGSLPSELMSIRPWPDEVRLREPESVLIEEFTAHGVAGRIIATMSNEIVRSFSRRTRACFPGLSNSEWFRKWNQFRSSEEPPLNSLEANDKPAWNLNRAVITRLLKFMSRERVLVADWGEVPIQFEKKLTSIQKLVSDAIKAAGKNCNKTKEARKALFNKTEGLSAVQERTVQSVLAQLRKKSSQ